MVWRKDSRPEQLVITELGELLAEASLQQGTPIRSACELQLEMRDRDRKHLSNQVQRHAQRRHSAAHPERFLQL